MEGGLHGVCTNIYNSWLLVAGISTINNFKTYFNQRKVMTNHRGSTHVKNKTVLK